MRYILSIFIFIYTLYGLDATIKIEKDVDQRAKVAIIDASDNFSPNREKLASIFIDDLKITGHFIPDTDIKSGNFSNPIFNPSFRNYDYLIVFDYQESGSASLKIKLIKASDSSEIFKRTYHISSEARYPFLVHKAVSEINAKLGFESVSWLNRYVLFAKYIGKKESEISIADYTFHYIKPIIKGGLNLFPVWGDKNQRSIYYTSYDSSLPTLYKLDFSTGKPEKIMNSQGMLVCSDVSKNGRKLLLTMAPSGQPDIYEYDLDTKNLKRLTTFSGIDVGGKYADNEQSVVFVSNRLGYANIFKISLADLLVSQIVFHGKNNNSCDAYNQKVVYASKENSQTFKNRTFNLYLTTTSSDYTRPLTSGGINEFPRFSPDGNTVLYIKRTLNGNSIGYIGLKTNMTMLFPMGVQRLQSIDW